MKIRPRTLPSGKVVYVLDFGIVNGKRKRPQYASKAKAEIALKAAKKASAHHGESAGDLTPAEVREFLIARERLEQAGARSILIAVDYYIAHAGALRERVSVAAMIERFIQSRREINASERYLRQLNVSLGSFKREYGECLAVDVTQDQVKAWLHGNEWEPRTRNGYITDLKTLWNWAIKSAKLATVNPAKHIPKALETASEIQVLTPDECLVLLSAAVGNSEMMGYTVLAMFAGVRRAEIERLDWSAVEFVEGSSEIGSKHTKSRTRRSVELPANALEWLRCAPPETGKICKPDFRERWVTFRRSLGWKAGNDNAQDVWAARRHAVSSVPITRGEWPANALRHTFASNHYALHRDESLLQAEMGHRDKDILFQNYRRLVTRASARKFWDLRPDPSLLLWSPLKEPADRPSPQESSR